LLLFSVNLAAVAEEIIRVLGRVECDQVENKLSNILDRNSVTQPGAHFC
jgi:hypothetical protein